MSVSMAEIQNVLDRESGQIAARIGAEPDSTRQAIALALPALLAGLQQQASPGTGLQQAVEQDHDGSILDDIAGYLQGTANLNPRTTDGEGILGHVLGGQQPQLQQALSSQSGLSMSSIAQLLPLLAPIVMGMLGRQARTDSSVTAGGGLGDLGSVLGGLLRGGSAGAQGGLGDVLGSILGGSQGR